MTSLLGILLSIAGAVLTRNQQWRIFNRDTQAAAENRFAAVTREAEATLATLTTVASLLDTRDKLTPASFRHVANAVQRENVGHLISFLPRVRHAERKAFESLLVTSGAPRSFIAVRDLKGSFKPAPDTAFYYPVLYAAPGDAARSGIGFDAASRPETLAAIGRATATRQVASSGTIRYVHDSAARMTFLAPIWWSEGHGAPDGFLVVGVQPAVLVNHALAYLQPAGIQISLWDETDPANPTLL
ncbi:MAG: CHASE domain-containing protein, partial [Bryobacteraceae bacterium]|nr:CHASE domain-containing protein [Bryobacteraceae bacterium]